MVTKKTMLNICPAPGISDTTGYVAKMMGTAPRRPTHETNDLERVVMALNGASERKTLRGRPTAIMKMPISSDTALPQPPWSPCPPPAARCL